MSNSMVGTFGMMGSAPETDFLLDPANPQPSPFLTEPAEHTLRWPRLGQATSAVVTLTTPALVIPINSQVTWNGTITINRPVGNALRGWKWHVAAHSAAYFCGGYVGDFYLIGNGSLNGDVFWWNQKLDSADDTYRNVYGLGHRSLVAAGAAAAGTPSVTLAYAETIHHRQSGAAPAPTAANVSVLTPARFAVWAYCDD